MVSDRLIYSEWTEQVLLCDLYELEVALLLLQILIQSICETMVPKLVSEDIPLLYSLLSDVFPGVLQVKNKMRQLRDEIATVCKEMHLVYGEGDEQGALWVEKVSK